MREVSALNQGGAGNMFLFGTAALSSTFIEHGLIDEYRLAMTPVVLGGGNPLFELSPDRLKLRLLEARPLKSGCVILR